MTRTKHPRLHTPAVMAVGGSAIAVASFVNSGWKGGLIVELFTVIATFGYYVLGGRDSDVGAIFGARPDERQTSVGTRAAALAGSVTSIVAVGGFVIATAMGAVTWPFALFAAICASSFLAGLFLYRAGG